MSEREREREREATKKLNTHCISIQSDFWSRSLTYNICTDLVLKVSSTFSLIQAQSQWMMDSSDVSNGSINTRNGGRTHPIQPQNSGGVRHNNTAALDLGGVYLFTQTLYKLLMRRTTSLTILS